MTASVSVDNVDDVVSRRIRGWAAAAFLGAGALIGTLGLVLVPGWSIAHRGELIWIALLVFVLALGHGLFGSYIPQAGTHVTLVAAIAGVGMTQFLVQDSVALATIGLFYVWAVIFAALFFSWLMAVVHLAVSIAVQVVVYLATDFPHATPVAIFTVGTSATAMAVVIVLTRKMRANSLLDALTGTANRLGMQRALVREAAIASRSGRPMCVAMLGLDGFKKVNDTYGQMVGDQLLQKAADSWRVALRQTDILGRCGGDEFVIILPDCELGNARDIACRLIDATPPQLRCSIGIADHRTPEAGVAAMERADAAMSRAKNAGGHRYVIANAAAGDAAAGRDHSLASQPG